jgi:hypothetical protein
MLRLSTTLLTLVVLMGLSCTEEVTPTPYTFTQVFTGETSKTWDLKKLSAKEKNKDVVTYNLNTCQGDDRYIFYANAERLYEVTNGRTQCNSEEEDLLISYTWEYNSATATLNMVLPHLFGYFIVPFTVVEITDKKMILEIPLNEENTTGYILEFTVVD